MLLELLIVSNNEHDHHGLVIDAHPVACNRTFL